MPRFVVSACLAGIPCRYDGKASPCPRVLELVNRGEAIPLCPEVLGGLPTPRVPCERRGDTVVTETGEDMTRAFMAGAEAATRKALSEGCTAAVLKARSPSCGIDRIHDGNFTGALRDGVGIWAEMLRAHGIALFSDERPPAETSIVKNENRFDKPLPVT